MEILKNRSLDALIFDFESLKDISELSDIVTSFLEGDYKSILRNSISQTLFEKLSQNIDAGKEEQKQILRDLGFDDDLSIVRVLLTGLAAFNAFLQINVTGPVLDLRDVFAQKIDREKFLRSLDVDGVSVYQHIPHVELFCLARLVFTVYFPRLSGADFRDCKWMRIRVNAYHQRLLAGVSVGRLIDSNLLQDVIERDIKALEEEILVPDSTFGTDAKVMFLLEKAQIYIMEGMDLKARENVGTAGKIAGFHYALSGALGKRTRFQHNDISQLVVFAKSRNGEVVNDNSEIEDRKAPQALDLNDDTVLEAIEFAKDSEKVDNSALPAELLGMKPDDQPQLNALDQITLLMEATIKDNLSPLDKLTSEEILPFAVRVLSDRPTNWQIYTQALLVRSRIESHRSRTMERSVLQLQVIVDQIIADTQGEPSASENGIPEIRVTQFLPRAKSDESAPISERLKYIFQLNTPTRWEIETELAFAWSNVGSLLSALEIFKRLKLWPEVALCYHSVQQEEKARQVVRRQLYYSTKGSEMDSYDIDSAEVAAEKWDGEVRSPPPPHAPRLWCILGDLDQNPELWELAWEISKHRYARAQRTLGEYYSRQKDLTKAREAYMKATAVNRQNNDTWSRLGDIDLAVGNWDGAVIAFQQSIMIDDTDAKTYSNLGSALLSKHAEVLTLQKAASHDVQLQDEDGDEISFPQTTERPLNPKDILRQALSAFKRGASLAHDNWRIWDNVITIAGRMTPPSFPDLLLALRAVIRIRSPTIGEGAVDIDVLRGLVLEVTSRERPENTNPAEAITEEGIYTAPRGSLARAMIDMIDNEVVPLITKRAELWVLVEKLKVYRKDYKGALACAEKAWRMVLTGEAWLSQESEWKEVVELTDHLVSAYENFGEQGWKGKARSAVRGVMGKGREVWEGGVGWDVLMGLLEGLKG